MDRRGFVRFVSVLAIGCVLPHCGRGAELKKEVRRILENEDREGFYIRFYKAFESVDSARWTLGVGGLCDHPRTFTLSALQDLQRETQASRMKCVESWSSKAKWGGFRPKSLFDMVRPKKEAKFLQLRAADDYYECIAIDDLLKPRVLFVYEMNDSLLPDIHGGPLRLIIPFKYGYKSIKTIVKAEFVEHEGTGYWSSFGYSKGGTIQPGWDYALDLKEHKELVQTGEPDY